MNSIRISEGELKKLQPLGNGLEARIRGKQGRINGLAGSGSLFVSSTSSSPITTTQRTWGMPASSNFNIVSYETVASNWKIASTNANDSSAGTGLRTVYISGLNGDWVAQNETITLNGQTPVSTVKSYLRVNMLFAQTAGSLGANQGDIFMSNSSDTFTLGIPNTQTLFAMCASEDADNPCNISSFGSFSVPANHRLWLIKGNYYINATEAKPILIKEDYFQPSGAGQRLQYTGGMLAFAAGASYAFDGAGAFVAKTDYNWKVNSQSGTVDGAIYYEATLEDMSKTNI